MTSDDGHGQELRINLALLNIRVTGTRGLSILNDKVSKEKERQAYLDGRLDFDRYRKIARWLDG